MDDFEKETRLKATSRRQRFFVYGLIGGQHLVNLLVRFALPFFVPFLVHEFGISDAERAAVLAANFGSYLGLPLRFRAGRPCWPLHALCVFLCTFF